MTSADLPIVFIVDDDARMRAAMQRLLKTVGLRSKVYGTPGDFLLHKRSQLPATGCAASGDEWFGCARQTDRGGRTNAYHFLSPAMQTIP